MNLTDAHDGGMPRPSEVFDERLKFQHECRCRDDRIYALFGTRGVTPGP
jgi:hypothetical protein